VAVADLVAFADSRQMSHSFGEVSKTPPTQELVLVVDAGEDLALVLKQMLQGRGVTRVEVAHDAFEAGLMVGVHRPAVVVIDPGMPDLDPWSALSAMRPRLAPGGGVVALVAVYSGEIRALVEEGLVEVGLTKATDLHRLGDEVMALLNR